MYRAGVAAFGWWNGGLAYCNRNLTDGFIPSRDLGLVYPGTPRDRLAALVKILIRERLLHVASPGRAMNCTSGNCRRFRTAEDGFLMHDFHDYQPSRAEVVQRRRIRAASGRHGGEISAKHRKQLASLLGEGRVKQLASPVANPVPSRPVPSRPELQKQEAKVRSVVLADDRFIVALKANPAYAGLDVDRELGKLDAWLLTPRGQGKQKTRQRIVNWLNRAERPVQIGPGVPMYRPNHSLTCACPPCEAWRRANPTPGAEDGGT